MEETVGLSFTNLLLISVEVHVSLHPYKMNREDKERNLGRRELSALYYQTFMAYLAKLASLLGFC